MLGWERRGCGGNKIAASWLFGFRQRGQFRGRWTGLSCLDLQLLVFVFLATGAYIKNRRQGLEGIGDGGVLAYLFFFAMFPTCSILSGGGCKGRWWLRLGRMLGLGGGLVTADEAAVRCLPIFFGQCMVMHKAIVGI